MKLSEKLAMDILSKRESQLFSRVDDRIMFNYDRIQVALEKDVTRIIYFFNGEEQASQDFTAAGRGNNIFITGLTGTVEVFTDKKSP